VFDFDADGDDDLFLFRPGSGAAWVARSGGDGTFLSAYGVGGSPSSPGSGIAGYDLHRLEDQVLTVDYNGDENADLFFYRPGSGAAWVASSNGDGSFAAAHSQGGSPSSPGNGIAGYDLRLGPSARSWHHNYDYRRWASGKQHDFPYEPEYADDAIATAVHGTGRKDRVEMQCPAFNDIGPAERASTMLHESTHMIFKEGGGWSHQNGKDDWLPHGLYQHAFETLRANRSGHKHSMYQIEIEFLCDIGEFAAEWVPAGVSNVAAGIANDLMTDQILNPPGWRCGEPRP